MGNQVGGLSKDKYLPGQKVTSKELLALQKAAFQQYPWLSDVKESMLVTDNRKTDCPIVYANDEFEAMTLYPKEEIVGRNCRFLQGKLTNRKTVQAIRKAVDTGKELEVEILNYRKDGVPFWNNFLMVPVFKTQRSKVVTHFIAIQKDITVIKQNDKEVEGWDSTEVGMWMDHNGFGEYAPTAIEMNINGKKLLKLNDDDLLQMRVMRNKHRNKILELIKAMKHKKIPTFRAHDKAEVYESPKAENGLNNNPNIARPVQLDLWTRNSAPVSQPNTVTFKAFFKDTIECFRMPSNCSFKELKARMGDSFDFSFLLKFEDKQGDMIDLTSNDDMEYLFSQHKGETVPVRVVRKKATKRINMKWVQSLGDPAFLLDWDGYILTCSPAVEQVFGVEPMNLQERSLRVILPALDFGVSSRRVQTMAEKRDGTQFPVSVSVSTTPNNTRTAIVVPL